MSDVEPLSTTFSWRKNNRRSEPPWGAPRTLHYRLHSLHVQVHGSYARTAGFATQIRRHDTIGTARTADFGRPLRSVGAPLRPAIPRPACYRLGMPDPVASAADTELLTRVEQVLAPTFELDHEVGRGGMGIVYLARDRRLKRSVAIKVLPPELAFRADIRSRFLREAETSAQLSHAEHRSDIHRRRARRPGVLRHGLRRGWDARPAVAARWANPPGGDPSAVDGGRLGARLRAFARRHPSRYQARQHLCSPTKATAQW